MDTEEYQWLGIVMLADVKPKVAMITPLAFYDPEAGEWEPVDGAARAHCFPNAGKATIFDREWYGRVPDQLYQFSPQLNHRPALNTESPQHARFWVPRAPEPAPLAQVLDWTSRVARPEDLPDALVSWYADRGCYTPRIYVRHGDLLFGPIQLDEDSRQPREFAQSTATGGPQMLVHKYSGWASACVDLTIEGDHVVLVDGDLLGAPDGEDDWSPPQVVIKHVLEASNTLSSTIQEEGRLVDRRIRELARLSSQEGPEALRVSLATLRRAQHIVDHQQEHVIHLADLGSALVNLPALKPRMDAAIDQAVQARSETIALAARQQAEQTLQHLEEVRAEVAQAETRLEAVEAEIAHAQEHKQQLQGELEAFERHLSDRIDQLRAQPLQALADLQLVGALLPVLSGGGTRSPAGMLQTRLLPHIDVSSSQEQRNNGSALPPPMAAGGWCTNATDCEPGSQPEELKRHWVRVAQHYGTRSQAVRACAAALLAGLVPAPCGERSLAALRAVADVVASGRIFVVPVPVTALSPLDLFGGIDPESRAFIPAAGALADVILASQAHPDDLGLVVLVGLDRVPGMPTYMPLLRHYVETQASSSDDRPPSLPVGLFHPRALVEGDPYAGLAWLQWPPNLLLAATCDESDGAAFPVPVACRSWLVRPEAGPAQMRVHAEGTSMPSLAFVPAAVWKAWGQAVCQQIATNGQQGGEEDSLPGEVLLRAAMTQLGTHDELDISAVIQASHWQEDDGSRANGEDDEEGGERRW